MATTKKVSVRQQRLKQQAAVIEAKEKLDAAKEKLAEERRKLKAMPTK